MTPAITIEKHWDGNECVTEHGNRVYVSRGRWQWLVIVGGVTESAHDRKRDAVARAAHIGGAS